MKSIWAQLKSWRFDILILGLYGFTITFMIVNIQFLNDIKIHNLILTDYLESGYFPLPPGYYGLVYLIDWVLSFKYPFVVSSIIVLSIFLWWKYRIVLNFFKGQIHLKKTNLFLFSLSFLFIGPIYLPGIDEGLWYLGKFTPTIWHNSTLIVSFPFSIILCLKSLKWIDKAEDYHLLSLLGLGLILMLIKPSFLFCYIPALPIYIIIRDRKFSPLLWKSVFLVLIFSALILLEKHLIFTWDPMREQMYEPSEISRVIFSPFEIWLHYSHQPILDLLSSIPLLICFIIFWKKKAFKDPMFNFTFILLIFSILVYFLFAETGFRQYHANFYWQIPIALFLNYLSILSIILRDYRAEGNVLSYRTRMLVGIYLIQVVFGFAYWVRIFAFETLI